MRIAIGIVCAAVVCSSTATFAAPSSDLVFCSKLPDKNERMACYDAAARIAETRISKRASATAAPPRATAPAIDVAADAYAAKNAIQVTPVVEKRRSFHGAYAAIGGSYGWSDNRTASSEYFRYFESVPPGFGIHVASTSPVHTTFAAGASAIAAVGYNLAFDRWLVGVELDGRWGNEEAKKASGTTALLIEFGTQLPSTHTYHYKNEAGFHISGRIGATFADTLIFGKLGIGASHIVETYSFSLTPSGGLFTSARSSAWAPSMIFGAGLEQNFGVAFARVSAELEAISASSLKTEAGAYLNGASTADGMSLTSRAMGMVGVRF
jgi:hypothetical protein